MKHIRRHHFNGFGRGQLRLDSTHKKLGGVCAGLARYFDVQSLFVRIIALIALFLAPEPTLIAYGLAYIILDDEPFDDR